MKAYGMKFGKTVILPPTAKDYSPQVAEATGGGADCVVMVVSETPYIAWNQACVQSGTTARMYGPQGNLDAVSIKGLGDKLDGSVIAGMYPDLATDPWADYRQALKDANADPGQDYNSLGGMGTWAAYTGLQDRRRGEPGRRREHRRRVVPRAGRPRRRRSTPTAWSRCSTSRRRGRRTRTFKRLFNRTVVFSTIKDGKVVPLTTEFEDVGDLALGKKP